MYEESMTQNIKKPFQFYVSFLEESGPLADT